MTYSPTRFIFSRVGNMTYEIRTERGGPVCGTVWRTRDGWSGRTASGRLVVEDYPGSRATAAGATVSHNAEESRQGA